MLCIADLLLAWTPLILANSLQRLYLALVNTHVFSGSFPTPERGAQLQLVLVECPRRVPMGIARGHRFPN